MNRSMDATDSPGPETTPLYTNPSISEISKFSPFLAKKTTGFLYGGFCHFCRTPIPKNILGAKFWPIFTIYMGQELIILYNL